MICPNCKREADEGNRFCKYCGYSFDDNSLNPSNSDTDTDKSTNKKAAAKKTNGAVLAVIILAAGVLLSAGILFIGYNVIKGRSLEKYVEENADHDKEVSPKKKKKKNKESKKETSEEETSATQESSLETSEETTYETYSYEETVATQEPMYTTLYVVNCAQSISLRTSPSTKATTIRQIPLGAAVSFVQNSTDGFYQISYMGDTGYALASYLSSDPTSSYRPPETYSVRRDYDEDDMYYGYVVNCRESITLRESPSTKAREIMQIPLHSVIMVYNSVGADFLYVSYQGYYGYVLASYVESY